MYAIETFSLTKKYKDITAVKSLELRVMKGEIFSLLGVNGAGKTTAIKMFSCLSSPTSGDALVGGYSISSEAERVKKIIAVSPQETAIAPNLSVKENLEFMCGIHGLSREKREEKIDELRRVFKLDPVFERRAGKLSGGWQRRLSIAIALISDPEILFLDEPTLGLDVIARSELWDIIRALRGETTVILTTHYMEEAEALSDRIGIMRDGSLLTIGTAKDIMKNAEADRFEDAFIKVVREVSE